MSLKKQITLLLLCGILLLTFSACGAEENAAETSAVISSSVTTEMETEPPTTVPTQPEEETDQPTETPTIVTEPKAQGNTYITRESEINAVTCPVFQFDYPDGWSITSEEVASNGEAINGLFTEKVVLSNNRGVTITFLAYMSNDSIGYGSIMHQITVKKIAESSFVPTTPAGTGEDYSSLGDFMVAKLKTVGELQMNTDSDYTKVDGSVYYAVLPESYKGSYDIVGMDGIYGQFRFNYPGPYAFIAEAPGGQFTSAEESEIIEILSSFRVAG